MYLVLIIMCAWLSCQPIRTLPDDIVGGQSKRGPVLKQLPLRNDHHEPFGAKYHQELTLHYPL